MADSKDTSSINQWDIYVNGVAAGSTLAGVPDITWFAVVSVDNLSDELPGIAAKDHAVASAPVYRTDGTLVATSSNFYTSTHLAPIKWNENGDEQDTNGGSGSGRLVWTGSTGSGDIDGRPLGNSPLSDAGGSRTGNAESINDDWINTSDATPPRTDHAPSRVCPLRGHQGQWCGQRQRFLRLDRRLRGRGLLL